VLLNVKDLKIYYKKAEAVKGVSFYVEEGTLVSIIGANGAGKTTILKHCPVCSGQHPEK